MAQARQDTDAATPTLHDAPDFQTYHAAGYAVIPIIPPGAPLSPGSDIDPGQCGKVPGRRGQQGWYGFDWIHHEPTADDLRAWQRAGAGIGIKTGRVIAVDIDVLDARLSARVVDVAHETLGVAPCRVGCWPKRLLVYRLADDAPTLRWRKLRLVPDDGTAAHDPASPLVELRGAHQQFVAEGTHPSGSRYTWLRPLPDTVEALPRIDYDALDAFIEALDVLADWSGYTLHTFGACTAGSDTRAHVDQSSLAADDPEALARMVRRYVPNDYATRDEYIRVGCAIKAAFAADPALGEQVFQEWAAKWDGNAESPDGNDPRVVAADYQRMQPPFELGARYLRELARAGGGAGEQAAQVFGPAESVDTGTDTGPDDGDVEFWAGWVYVQSVKRFVAVQERPGLRLGQMLDQQQFSTRYAGEIGSTVCGEKSPAALYLKTPAARRVIDDVTYRPGGERLLTEANGARCANLWRPGPAHDSAHAWAGTPADDVAVAPWLELLRALLPSSTEQAVLLDWLAYQIKCPGEKCNWHPLLWGEQGIGKDTLIVPLLRALGDNATTVSADTLTSTYTDWIEGRQLVVVEEINQFERRSVMDKLKPLLSTPPDTIAIEKKYISLYHLPNLTNLIFFSNHDDALALEQTDRRFFVLASPLKKGELPPAFFRRLYRWYDRGGDRLVTGYLAAHVLSAEFAPKSDAPVTAAKTDMQRLAMGVVESDLLDAIGDNDDIFEKDLVTVGEVQHWFARCYGERKSNQFSTRKTGRLLARVGAVQIGRTRLDGGGRAGRRMRVWAVRRAEMYASAVVSGGDGELRRLYQRALERLESVRARQVFTADDADDDDDGTDDDTL